MCSEDTQQRWQSILAFGLSGYRVMMASMLAVFVPQQCPESPSNECTLRDNFIDLIPFNTAVLVVNFLTLASLITLLLVEYLREQWCITSLDFDEKQAITALSQHLVPHPEIRREMETHAKRYYLTSIIAIACNMVNVVMSAVLIYHFYYLDYKSITVLISYVLLIADKLANAFLVSRRSFEECIVQSAYRSGPAVYNVIDPDRVQASSGPETELTSHETSHETSQVDVKL